MNPAQMTKSDKKYFLFFLMLLIITMLCEINFLMRFFKFHESVYSYFLENSLSLCDAFFIKKDIPKDILDIMHSCNKGSKTF